MRFTTAASLVHELIEARDEKYGGHNPPIVQPSSPEMSNRVTYPLFCPASQILSASALYSDNKYSFCAVFCVLEQSKPAIQAAPKTR